MNKLKIYGYGYMEENSSNIKIIEFFAINEEEANKKALKFAVDNEVFIQPYGVNR